MDSAPLLTTRRITLALCAVPVVFLAALAWRHRWVADDAFINFRVVSNLQDGLGPVWNAGERVEVYTSTLWLGLLWLGSSVLGVAQVEWIAVVLGILATLGGLCAAGWGAWLFWRGTGREGVGVPLGLLVFVVLRPVWDYSTSGLETGLIFLWLGGCFWLLARHNAGGRARPTLTAVAIGLGPLVRPDLAIFAIGFMVALFLSPLPERRAGRLRLVGWAILLPLAYQVFRMGYFAVLEPNTALAKEAGLAYWSRGWDYLTDFAGTYLLVIPLVLLLAYAVVELRSTGRPSRGARATALAPVVCALLHALYIVRVGGDFMHARMLLPSLFGLLLPVAVVIPPRRRLQLALAAALLPWVVVCAIVLEASQANRVSDNPISDESYYYSRIAGTENPVTLEDFRRVGWVRAGRTLRTLAEDRRALVLRIPFLRQGSLRINGPPAASSPAPVVGAFVAVGLMGYAAGPNVHIVDQLGVTDPLGSRTRLGRVYLPPGFFVPYRRGQPTRYARVPARARAGHEKYLPTAWIAARFGPAGVDRYPNLVMRPAAVQAARRVLRCPRLRRLLTSVTAPMSVDRFVSNIGDSFSLTTLRFPAAPLAAERELCQR